MRTAQRLRTSVLALPFLFVLAMFLSAEARGVEKITNGVYQVNIRKSTENGNTGAWNANTGPLHDTGAGNDLIYQGEDPSTSFSSLRVYRSDGTVADYPGRPTPGSTPASYLNSYVIEEKESPLAPAGRGWRTVWGVTPEKLRITQDVLVIGTGTSNSAIYHTVEIANTGQLPARIGWRNLHDWQVGDRDINLPAGRVDNDDGPSNQLEGACGTVLIPATTREFSHSPVTARIARISVAPGTPTYQPLLALAFDPGFLPNLPVTAPDQYVYGSWVEAFDTSFDYTATNAPITGGLDGDSAGLSWFGRTPAQARTIPPGSSVRFTQAIFAAAPDGCLQPCLRHLSDKILCTDDGTGDFTYTFQISNLSQSAIHHLFLLDPQVVNDPDRQISFSTSYLSFTNNPLQPGGLPQTRTVRIRGAQPGEAISFLLSGLDQYQSQCCAVQRTITLPPCDCGQVLSESGPVCRFRPPGSYNYSFELQNLFPGDVKYVLLTPSPVSGVTPGRSSFTLNPILGQYDKAIISTLFGNVTTGSPACFRIGLHSPSFEQCCSIERCVTPERCFVDFNDHFSPVGNGTFELLEPGIVLSGFGSSGQDGVSITTGEALAFDVEWLPLDATALPEGARLTTTFRGVVDGTPGVAIGTMKATKTGGAVEMRTDFSPLGATRQRIEYYYQGELVNVLPDHPNGEALPNGGFPPIHRDAHFAIFGGPASDVGITPCSSEDFNPRCLFAGYTFKVAVFNRDLGYVFDEFRVYPLALQKDVASLSNVLIQGALLPSLTLTSANTRPDCNGNSVPDDEDIANGTSVDANRDGLPDDCRVPSTDLHLVLNTGFDEVTGALLPLGTLPDGTADHDWRVVSTDAPAKLVIGKLPAWRTTLPDTQWISVQPDRGRSLPGLRTIELERCFCLNGDATSATLDLQFFADDLATVFLNEQQIGGPGGQFRRAAPLAVHLTGAVGGNGPFRAGQNCLRVAVADTAGVVTGLDLAGSVTAANGACSTVP